VGAIRTTVEGPARLNPMPDDLAPAMVTGRGQSMDGAFEAVEDVRLASHDDLEGFVIIIPTYFTSSHFRRSFPLRTSQSALRQFDE
jgi:hypothetical protein